MKNRINFLCSSCGIEDDAIVGTKRERAKLCRLCFGKRKDTRKNELNNLSGKQWAEYSRSVEQYNGIRPEKQKFHGACFPLSLAEQQIKIYTKKGQKVYDPFMGVGTTLEASENLERKSVGIELSKNFVKLAKKDIKNKKNHIIICDDVRNAKRYIQPNSIDFQLTSPPYGHLLKTIKGNFAYKWQEHSTLNKVSNPLPYSKDKKDLGNLSYSEFIEEIEKVFKDTFTFLKEGAYAVWVVKDYRDLKNKVPYVNFNGDIIKVAEKVGFNLWDMKVYDQTKFRPLVVLGYPSKNYYLNMGHSYILVFRKYINGRYSKKPNKRILYG